MPHQGCQILLDLALTVDCFISNASGSMSKQHLATSEVDLNAVGTDWTEFAEWLTQLKQTSFQSQGKWSKCIDPARYAKWETLRTKVLPQDLQVRIQSE